MEVDVKELEARILSKSKEWAKLPPNTLEAAEFYFANVLPLVVFKLKADPDHLALAADGCDLLISTAGFSPETTVIATEILKPSKLFVIGSEKSSRFNNLFMKHLIANGLVEPTKVRTASIDPNDIGKLTRQVDDAMDWAGRNARAVVDITGGKKVMSAVVAIAAWINQVRLCYIDGDYSPEIRRPLPGSEKVKVWEHPGITRANLLREEAISSFAAGRMGIAADRFGQSRDHQLRNQAFDELGRELALLQLSLSEVNMRKLGRNIETLREIMARPAFEGEIERAGHLFREKLECHLNAATAVIERDDVSQLALFGYLSDMHEKRGRYDFACLLAYRQLELILQVAIQGDAVDGEFSMIDPNYAKFALPATEILERFRAVSSCLFGTSEEALPKRLSLVSAFILLNVLARQDLAEFDVKEICEKAGHLRQIVDSRNASVLAHGFSNVDQEQVDVLRKFADRTLNLHCRSIYENVRALRESLRPPDVSVLHSHA